MKTHLIGPFLLMFFLSGGVLAPVPTPGPVSNVTPAPAVATPTVHPDRDL